MKLRKLKNSNTWDGYEIFVMDSMRSIFYVVKDGEALCQFYYFGNSEQNLNEIIVHYLAKARDIIARRGIANDNVSFIENKLEKETVEINVTGL